MHACRFPQPGAQPRNIKMNGQSRAHIHNLNALTGLTKHHVGRSTQILGPHGSHTPTARFQNGGSAGVPHLVKYDVCLFGLMELILLWLTVKMGLGQFRRIDEFWQRALNNPPAASDEWCNPGRAAMPPLR